MYALVHVYMLIPAYAYGFVPCKHVQCVDEGTYRAGFITMHGHTAMRTDKACRC